MNIQKNVSLKNYTTMRLGGVAASVAEITNSSELSEALAWAEQSKLPVVIVGSGSNIVWRDEGFSGLLLVNKIKRFDAFNEDANNTYLTVGAGENWDSVVERSVDLGLSGVEQLSLIPGTAGATPVQNVGAYGRELADILVSVEAYDSQAGKLVNIDNQDCGFTYRSSRFKTTDKGRFFISAITLHLTKSLQEAKEYAELQSYLDNAHITDRSAEIIRKAVIAIRQAKLPDPNKVPNNGSFFTNPIIDRALLAGLTSKFPGLKYWDVGDKQVKLSAAWLIENAGLKGYKDDKMGLAIWPSQPLVIVNNHADSTARLMEFKQNIIDIVKAKYGVTLSQEPELLPHL